MAAVIMCFLYFSNGGSFGTIIYLIVMLLTIMQMVIPPRFQLWLLFGILYAIIFILLVLEYLHPDWVVPYHSRVERLLDHGIGILYTVFFITVVIVVFRRSYIRERNQVRRQNEDLLLLKAELEQSVALANDRHERIQIILKELHHRVKNNLQVISSLLALQYNRMEDDAARASLEASRTRIEAMALIHKGLYQNEDVSAVEIGQYLASLAGSLAGSFGYGSEVIKIDVQLQQDLLDIDRAIPLGLIVNELVSNAFKHAFSGIEQPQVRITLIQRGHGLELQVADNGRGLQDMDDLQKPGSFGMKLVRTLVLQLNAQLHVEHNKGTIFRIVIT
ncbi:sensor histidine kinase [Chitinophaga cymbidii]|uniref:sensor histidine kinase n=1 Tax=Chitinophaga cymbidii TaxID=1096750 RepID=UPI00164C4678|nr:sensor histidine kinase [Chitinophaga cymbidii]